jgi:triosephosphate isomerase
MVLIGENVTDLGRVDEVLASRLPHLFMDCERADVARMALIYEPEWSIGAQEPAPPDYISAGCSFMRDWIARAHGPDVADKIRIIYGGGVSPENVKKLLASPDLDGLGAGRKGRDPFFFAQIVRLIAESKSLIEVTGSKDLSHPS